MVKVAISVTLAPENIAWLKAHAVATGAPSLSGALDRLVEESRTGTAAGPVRSVHGTARIEAEDPGPEAADAWIRRLFAGAPAARRTRARDRG